MKNVHGLHDSTKNKDFIKIYIYIVGTVEMSQSTEMSKHVEDSSTYRDTQPNRNISLTEMSQDVL